jgi:hypothetical protein
VPRPGKFFRIGSAADAGNVLRYWLGRDGQVRVFSRDAWLILGITLIWYAIAYALNDSPSWHAGGNAGWLTWWDQGHYHQAAGELARGELRANPYWIGYPAIGAMFYHLLPRHPFLLPDLAMVLAIVGVFYAAARLYLSRFEAVLMVYVFIWLDSLVRDECLVVPWNTLPAYTAFFVSIYLLVLRPRTPRVSDFVLCAGLIGVATLARPTEIVALGLVFVPGLIRLGGWRERAVALGCLAGILIAVGTTLVLVNEHLYHALKSPYIAGESEKMNGANYGLKAYQFLADSLFLTGDGALPVGTRPPSLLSRYPEFLFVLPGLLFLLRERGWAASGAVLAAGFTVGFYLLYVPFDNPPYAWSYGQWHYVGWMLPWLGLATYLTFRQAFRALPWRLFLVALGLPLAATLVVGFVAVPEGWAAPGEGTGLSLTTNFTDGIYTVKLRALASCRADDLRLTFLRPPPFYGTEVSTVHVVHVFVNEKPERDMTDCMTSQENATYHFSFLAHNLVLRAGDEIEIRFQVREAPELARAELETIRFAPLQAWRDNFSSDAP